MTDIARPPLPSELLEEERNEWSKSDLCRIHSTCYAASSYLYEALRYWSEIQMEQLRVQRKFYTLFRRPLGRALLQTGGMTVSLLPGVGGMIAGISTDLALLVWNILHEDEEDIDKHYLKEEGERRRQIVLKLADYASELANRWPDVAPDCLEQNGVPLLQMDDEYFVHHGSLLAEHYKHAMAIVS